MTTRHLTTRELAVLKAINSTPGISTDNLAAITGYSSRATRAIVNVLQSHEESAEATGGIHSLTAKGRAAMEDSQ